MKYFRTITLLLLLWSCFGYLIAQSNSLSYNCRTLTIRDGLCDNTIRAIHKDRNSFMWFGTSNGLDRYDGYEFRHYSVSSNYPEEFIESNYINAISEDSSGHLWIATEAGVMYIDLFHDNIESYQAYDGKYKEVLHTPVQTLLIDNFDNLWIGKNDCVAYVRMNEKREIEDIQVLKSNVNIRSFVQHGSEVWACGDGCLLRFAHSGAEHFVNIPLNEKLDFSHIFLTCAFSYGDSLWLGSQNGLYYLNTRDFSLYDYHHIAEEKGSLSSDFVTCITQNSSGELVVGTRKGINLRKVEGQFHVYSRKNDLHALNDNFINCIFVDEEGSIWTGTEFGGVNIISLNRVSISYFLRENETGIPHVVSSVFEDNEGNLLVGMVDGGLAIRLKDSNDFISYRHDDNDKTSLAHDNISRILQDSSGNYWIATIGGGIDKLNKRNLKSPIFEHYNTSNTILPSNKIYDIALDTIRNSLWICSNDYIHNLSLKTGTIDQMRYYTNSGEELHNMNTIFVDSKSRLWIGGNGVAVIDLNNPQGGYECFYYRYKLDNPESKISEKITCIFETNKHELYFGSLGNGIYQLDSESITNNCKFINYNVRCGLSDTSIATILDDEIGNLWISTLKGIYFFDNASKRAFKFDQEDGLLIPYFHKKAGCRSKNNSIWLGTTDGLVKFNTLKKFEDSVQHRITLTNITCEGEILYSFLNPKNLPTSIATTDEVHLYPPQNSLEISFSCLDYLEPEKIFYAYRILELDKAKNIGLMKRNAKYTNLSPGRYTLEIQCTNRNNTWSSERKHLHIIVHPPFYETTWFYSLALLVITSALLYGIYLYNKRQKNIQLLLKRKINERTQELNVTITELTDSRETILQQNKQLHEQNEEICKQKDAILAMSRKMEDINMEKLSYFTNMAHEFKTPLTLIQGPAKQLAEHITLKEQQENAQIILRNAKYLLSMVDRLIDLRRLDSQKFTLNFTQFNFRELLSDMITDFSTWMQKHHIAFELRCRMKSDIISSDKENLQKILFNLLSNAVKYTPEKGKVILRVCQFKNRHGVMMQYISVTNTGSYIAREDAEHIFERFYRVETTSPKMSYEQSSTGIGLYIVKEIVTLLGGIIKVCGSKSEGVSFRLCFPVTLTESKSIEKTTYSLEVPLLPGKQETYLPLSKDKPLLLLVEDNTDMRHYIKDMLQPMYNIAEAENGEQGYEIARKLIPDLIISDLMMPICDGMEFCRKIRSDRLLNHVPFVLLTAISEENALEESFEYGIDGYITKPFSKQLLLSQLKIILKNRENKEKIQEKELPTDWTEIGQPDKNFMNEVTSLLEQNYTNPDFGVKELTDKMHISYAVIYKKLVSLTGLSPVRFIMLYRLRKAKTLLENSSSNVAVSEIAYKVGFNDPKYFTRVFVKQYGRTPSDMVKS